ncbi:MAG: hypothetical protein IIX67_00725 [Clostridia bacterium]|nr:hypothetical protein [Clostridia bacterium]
MKKLTRTLALLLCAVMMFSVFAACEETGTTSEDESVSAAESGNAESSFDDEKGFFGYEGVPEGTDYDGRTVKVLTLAAYQIKPEDNPEYASENMTAVLTAASESTRLVEQLLNVKVEEEGISTGSRYGGPFYKRVYNDAMSQTADYLFIMPALTEAAMLASDGLLYDLNALVDLKNPWWCKEFNDAVTIAGKTYFASGDITTVGVASTMIVLYNKEIEKKHGLAQKYGYESMYEMVDKKAWTQDGMFEMAKSVYTDSNENNVCDPDDMVGMSAQHNVVYWLLRSGGISVCTLDEDGYPVLTVNNERAISLITKAQEYCQDPQNGLVIADEHKPEGGGINPCVQAFIDGRGLFFFNAISAMDTIRSMEDDFGVLPCPMFDNTQDNYTCNVGAWTSNCIAIPTSVAESDLELAVQFIESLGAVSRKKLTPTYFEQTLQYQISRDDDSMRMLELINENRVPDLSEMYRWGKMMQTIADLRTAPVGTFVSAYDAIDEQTIIEIEETVEKFKNSNK